jgi:RimJ/RimL family protein N-acetyltransferase
VADEVRLRDGTDAWVMPLLATDRDRLVEEFEKLSPESRRRRFLTPVVSLSDAMLHHLVDEVDGIDHVALVLFAEHDGVYDPVGIGRMVRYPAERDAADLAVTVRDDWQGRGVATGLLPVLVERRPEGVTRILTEVAIDNPASLAMLRRIGPTQVHDAGFGVYDVEVHLDGTPFPEEPELPAGERLHPALRERWREAFRVRDTICPWLRAGARPGVPTD